MKKLYTTATALLLAAASFAQTPAITDDIEKTTKAVMEQAATEADSLQKASPWKSSVRPGSVYRRHRSPTGTRAATRQLP